MKIGELAKRTGLSTHTIRYYERIGLLPNANRDRSSHRTYAPNTLAWVEFLKRLKQTGMPIREMVEYANLREQGEGTAPERRVLLERHRDRVRLHMADLEASLHVLDAKIDGYVKSERRNKTT